MASTYHDSKKDEIHTGALCHVHTAVMVVDGMARLPHAALYD